MFMAVIIGETLLCILIILAFMHAVNADVVKAISKTDERIAEKMTEIQQECARMKQRQEARHGSTVVIRNGREFVPWRPTHRKGRERAAEHSRT